MTDMNDKNHSWIMFIPQGQENNQPLRDFMRQVRMTYHMIANSGLRNPETDFNPRDYFGYCLPMTVPASADASEPRLDTLCFGLVHVKDRAVFGGDLNERNAHLVAQADIRAVSLRIFGFEEQVLIDNITTYPMSVRWFRCWAGMRGWHGGKAQFGSETALVRSVVNQLISPSGFTDQEATDAATELLKKFRGGN